MRNHIHFKKKHKKTKNTHLPRNLQDRKTIYYCYCNGRETSILWIVYGSILWLSCCASTHMLQDFLLDTTSRITPYINTDSAFRLLDDCVASWPSLHNLPKENPTSRCMDCHSCRAQQIYILNIRDHLPSNAKPTVCHGRGCPTKFQAG